MRLSLSREYVSQPCFIHRVSPPSCMNICWCEVACVKETWNYLRLSSYPHVCMSAQSLQLCPTLCNPMDYTVRGVLQARILEWVAFPFSRGPSQPRNWTGVSCIAGEFFTNWAVRVNWIKCKSTASRGRGMLSVRGNQLYCGAVLVNPQWLLTDAHSQKQYPDVDQPLWG